MNNEREPTDAEIALFDRIVDGMMLKPGPVNELSCPKAAFRAWCLTVIEEYTDWLLAPAAADRDAGEKLYISIINRFDKALQLAKASDNLGVSVEELKELEIFEDHPIARQCREENVSEIAAALSAARGDERKMRKAWVSVADDYRVLLIAEQAKVKELEAAAREGLNPHCNVCELGREGRCHSGCNWFRLAALVKAEEVER